MDDSEATTVRIVRLRRLLAAAEKRLQRRHQRAMHVWQLYRETYGKQPRFQSKMCIFEAWDGRSRLWSYHEALALEEETALLITRLHNLRLAAQRPPSLCSVAS